MPEGDLKDIIFKDCAPAKAVENALRERTVVTIKVMTAGGADDLRLSLKEPARGITRQRHKSTE